MSGYYGIPLSPYNLPQAAYQAAAAVAPPVPTFVPAVPSYPPAPAPPGVLAAPAYPPVAAAAAAAAAAYAAAPVLQPYQHHHQHQQQQQQHHAAGAYAAGAVQPAAPVFAGAVPGAWSAAAAAAPAAAAVPAAPPALAYRPAGYAAGVANSTPPTQQQQQQQQQSRQTAQRQKPVHMRLGVVGGGGGGGGGAGANLSNLKPVNAQQQQQQKQQQPQQQQQQQQQKPAIGSRFGGKFARQQQQQQHKQRAEFPPRPFNSSVGIGAARGRQFFRPGARPPVGGVGLQRKQQQQTPAASGPRAKSSTAGGVGGGVGASQTTPDGDEIVDAPPVGYEYIEELRVPDNQNAQRGGLNRFTPQYRCKLCDCRFTDPQAKEMHVKGRRHRLQFKKKVDPNLEVDVKPSVKARRVQEERVRPTGKPDVARQQADARGHEMQMMEMSNYIGYRGVRPAGAGVQGVSRQRIESNDDRYAMAKHSSIYPTEEELQLVQSVVSRCEKSLKLVSDALAEESEEPVLKGVMRVGVLAKGLLLHGDLATNLVLLCAAKPTRSLLQRVFDLVPAQLGDGPPQLVARLDVEEAAILVECEDTDASCCISLTSPAIRDPQSADKPDPEDILDKEKCLEALASLRHAKWFQAKARNVPSCLIVTRLLRDLCQRVTTWAPFPEWAMELIVEQCITSGAAGSVQQPASPGESLRRVFECLAAGLLLPGGPGVRDPCEREPTDACASLTGQEREDITASAQQALRLIAFRQLHKVLDMQRLPPVGAKRPAAAAATASSSSDASDAAAAAADDAKKPAASEPTQPKLAKTES